MGEPVEQSEAEIGASDLHRRAMPSGTAHARGLFEQRRGLADAGETLHAREDPPFGEAFGATGTQLEARGADHGMDDFARGTFDAAVGDRHREAALLNNAADLLHAAGQHDEAIERLKSAVAIFAEIGEEGAMEPEIWKLVDW